MDAAHDVTIGVLMEIESGDARVESELDAVLLKPFL
jgi:hypothetical protein